nr:MAG TPA: hypothetical protein [Caudoviricetes sp.]
MAKKAATREDYMKKYGLTTGLTEDEELKTVSDRMMENARDYTDLEKAGKKFAGSRPARQAATRENYARQYGQTVRKEDGFLSLGNLRKQYKKDKEAMEFAEKIKNQTPKYGGTVLKPAESDRMISGAKANYGVGADWDRMIREGREKDKNKNYTISGIRSEKVDLSMVDPGADRYKDMTTEEEDQYYYLLGKYGEKEAKDYLNGIDNALQVRRMEREKAAARKLAKEHPVIGTLGNISASMLSGLGYLSDVTKKEYDPYSEGHYASAREAATREALKETAREKIWDSAATDFLVDTGLSIGQSVARLPMGKTGAALAGLEAATGGVEDAMERGASFNQALGLGLAYGAAETGMERISIGGLQAMKDAPVYGLRDVAKNLGKQMATEASEEMATEFANTLSDRWIMGDKSNLSQAKKAYQEAGKSPWNAYLDIAKQIGLAGLGGAISGGVMGSGAAAIGVANQNRLGKGDMDFQEIADTIDTDTATYKDAESLERARNLQGLAQSYADIQSRGETLTGLQKGGFMRDYYDLARGMEEADQHILEKNVQEDMKTNLENETGTKPQDVIQELETDTMARTETMIRPDQKEERIREAEEPVAPVQPDYTREEVAEHGNFGENGQKAFADSYDGMSTIDDYRKAFGRYYDAGRYNAEMETAEKAAIASVLTPDQAAAAYKAGAQDRNLIAGQRPEYVQGAPKTGMASDLSGMATGVQMQFAESVGKKTGLKIELVSKADGKAGAYVPEKGVIRLAVDSGNFLQTTSHELTHFIKDYAPDYYEGYKQTVIQALMNADNVSYDGLVEQYERRYQEAGQNLSREEITEEIAADATGRFLNDEAFIENLARDNRTIAEKIRDFLSDMVDAIKQLISGKGISKAAEGLHEQLDYYEQARDMYAYALEESSKKRKAGFEITSGKQRYMVEKPELVTKEEIEKNFNTVRNMDTIIALSGGEFRKSEKGIIDQVDDFFQSLEGRVYNDVLGQVYLSRAGIKDDIGHGIGRMKAITFGAVPAVIEHGKVLDYQKDRKGRGWDSAVIGGKIRIEKGEFAGDYFVAVAVKVAKDNHLYLHEVYQKKIGGDTPIKTRAIPKNGSPSDAFASSIYSIFKKLEDVNAEFGESDEVGSENHEETEDADLKPGASESAGGDSAPGDSVRFQLEDVDQEQYDSLTAENKELQEANEELKRQLTLTKDYAPRIEDIKKTARELLKTYNSGYSQKSLENNLSKLYTYMHSTGGSDMEETDRAALAIARSIVKNARLEDDIREEYKGIISHMRTTRITLSANNRADLDAEGGYETFRKKYFGKLRIGNEGTGVDKVYDELAGMSPELFPAEIINPADQLIHIAQVYDSLQPQIRNPYHANMDEMAEIIAQEIKGKSVEIRALPPTMADRMQAEVFRANRKYLERTEAYKNRLKGEYESDITAAEKEASRQRQEINLKIRSLAEQYRAYGTGNTDEEKAEIRKLKKENWKKQEELRAKRKELEDKVNFDLLAGKMKYQRRRDAAESRKHREHIIRDVNEMGRWLDTPTDKKHVPESLRVPLAEFLSGMDYSSSRTNTEGKPTNRTVQWLKLKDQFAEIAEAGSTLEEGGTVYMDVDPDLAEKMIKLTDRVDSFDRLEDLELKDLRILRDVVASIKHCIQDANRLFENKNYEKVEDVSKMVLKDLKDRAGKVEFAGVRGTASSLLNYEMLDAGTMFEQMGPAMETVYKEARRGFDKKIENTKNAQDYMEKLLKDKNISQKMLQEWTGKKAEQKTFEVGSGTLTLTPAQIMSLYVLNKRDAARGHIYNKTGGIKSAPTLTYDKEKHGYVIKKAENPIAVTALEVQKITDTLSQEQKDIADAIVKYFTTVTSEWGNEVSMRLYGYKKFNAKNYFPIVSDKNYIPMKETELGATLTTLKNMGSTKHTIPGANNPIIIEDIFDVYTRQADQMGSYNAFVVPLADMQKVLNYKDLGAGSVKEALERVFGKDGQKYIEGLMIDLNGTAPSERNFVAELTRNMKSAAVGANLRTAIQQPTAYVRAAAEISPKYLAKGLKLHVGKEEWERCKKYAPIAQWKDWGYFDINTGRSMKNIMMGPENLKESIIEKSMWMAGKGDEIAWARLWMAVQEETKDLHPEIKEGSEEFYRISGERFSEIIDKTQVVDSVLHRSKLMKSKDGLKQMYTSFMSEPTKTYNMLYRAIADTRIKPTSENKKKLARTLGVYVINAAATALAASVVDALRDDDEDKNFKEKYRAALFGDLWQDEELSWPEKIAVAWSGNLGSNLDPVGILPIVKDIESIFMGYSIERTDMSAFQELYYTIQKWQKKIEGESDRTIPELLVETAKPLSTITGIPAGNVLKDLKAVVGTFIQSFGSPEMNYARNKLFKDIDSPDNLSNYVAMAMKQYADGNAEMGDRIIRDLEELEIEDVNKKIKSRYTKKLKEDPRVIQAAESKRNGKTVEYSKAVKELEEAGYEREYIISAVNSLVNKAEADEEEEGTGEEKEKAEKEEKKPEKGLYTAGDVVKAAESSVADFNMVVDELIRIETEEAKEAGKSSSKAEIQKEVRSRVKSAFTREYKKSYVSGTNADRQQIRKKLYKIKIDGKQLYSDTDFKNWIEEK